MPDRTTTMHGMFWGRRAGVLVVLTAVVGAVVPAAGMGTTNVGAARPTKFKVIINGKALTASQMTAAADAYVPTRAGRVKIVATWTNDVHNSGYYVLVSDMRSSERRRCTVGTSCSVTSARPLARTAEMAYAIRVVQVRGHRVISTRTVCLIGR